MVSEEKKKIVKKLVENIEKYPIAGIVNMQNLPAKQLQMMKSNLRGQVELEMQRKKLMQLALDKAKKENVGELKKYMKGMPAFLFTEENPFKLYKIIEKNKSKAPAKPGQEAPKDIVIQAGPTPFAPGPIIGELSQVGIQSGVEEGKVVIKANSTVAKEGEKISPELADILKRLSIEPMEIGLDLVAINEDGLLMEAKELKIDEEEYFNNIKKGAQWAFNLVMEAGYVNGETAELLMMKAFSEARALALEGNIMTDLLAEQLISKAESQAKSLKAVGEKELKKGVQTGEEVEKEKAPKELEKDYVPAEIAVSGEEEKKEGTKEKEKKEEQEE